MLSPVQAITNATLANTSHGKAAIVAENPAQLSSAPNIAAALSNPGAAPDIKGKIGMLLIAARERMIDSLFAAIDAAGKAAVVTPLPGESRLSYASRVADKINALPAGALAAAERNWSQQGQAVTLKLIAAALKNPTGEEAVAVIAYLETARYRDRDLAARAVMRSYRQNDGSSFKPAVTDRDAATQAKAAGIADEGEEPPKEATSARQAPASRVAISAQALQTSARTAVENTRDVPAAAIDEAEGVAVSEPEDRAEDVVSPQAEIETDASSAEAEAEPAIPDNWKNVIGTLTRDTAELLLTVIGEENVQTLLSETDGEVPDETQAAMADQIEEQPVESAIEKNADGANPVARQAAAPPAQETNAATGQAAARDAKLPVFPQSQAALSAETQQQAAALAKTIPGIGLSAVPYDFDKDAADAGDTTRGYRSHYTDGDGGGQPKEQHGQPRDDHAGEEEPPAPSPSADIAQDGRAEQAVADPAFDFYRRMAGW